MFLSQLNVLHWCSPVSSVGKDGWKLERMEKLIQIQDWYHRIYLSDGWNAQFKKRQTYLAQLIVFNNTLKIQSEVFLGVYINIP
jgi:hypothetical protein